MPHHLFSNQPPSLSPEQTDLLFKQLTFPCHTQALHESTATAKALADASASLPPEPLPPSEATEAPAAETTTPSRDTSEEISILQPVDYDGLVDRALSQEKAGLGELRRKAKDAGVVSETNEGAYSSRQV